jgi:hypothetical protein
MRTFVAELFIPSHGEKTHDIKSLIEINKAGVYEIMAKIQGVCDGPITTEEILQRICIIYEISLNATQYVLLLSTIRSFLTYLYEEGRLECLFDNGKMMWKSLSIA